MQQTTLKDSFGFFCKGDKHTQLAVCLIDMEMKIRNILGPIWVEFLLLVMFKISCKGHCGLKLGFWGLNISYLFPSVI